MTHRQRDYGSRKGAICLGHRAPLQGLRNSPELAILVPIQEWKARTREQRDDTASSCFMWSNTYYAFPRIKLR